MFKQRILEDLKRVVGDLGYGEVDIVLSIPKNSEFGDYTTNLALQLAKSKSVKGKHSPEVIAKEILSHLGDLSYLEKTEVAGGGFINFFIKPDALLESLRKVCDYSSLVNPELNLENNDKQKILVEYASFNALKPIHVGHMRNIILGESVSRLLESTGDRVFRVTYTSDIGLPSAKVVWALMNSEKEFRESKKKTLRERIEFLGKIYVKGHSAYEEVESKREEIKVVNNRIYQRDPQVVKIWQEALSWAFEYFQNIYVLMGSRFDKEILESEVEGPGAKIVRENLGKIFIEDQGAIIFPGEQFGLHNRVFISSVGNPTYEAKDMALAEVEYEAFNFDEAIHVVASDQDDYFKVIFKALEQLNPDLAKKESHLSYGYVFGPSGKMSSRKGNVITLEEIYDQIQGQVKEIVKNSKELKLEEKEEVIRTVSLGAMKYSILKYAPRTDVTFDIEKSVSLQGDSGPYIQYSYARAKSVLRNAQFDYQVDLPHSEAHPISINHQLEVEERQILRKIEHFEEAIEESAGLYAPNTLTQYLLELASLFNLFYQKHPILKSEEKSEFRLALTCAVAVILKQGLYLLGIEAPERM